MPELAAKESILQPLEGRPHWAEPISAILQLISSGLGLKNSLKRFSSQPETGLCCGDESTRF